MIPGIGTGTSTCDLSAAEGVQGPPPVRRIARVNDALLGNRIVHDRSAAIRTIRQGGTGSECEPQVPPARLPRQGTAAGERGGHAAAGPRRTDTQAPPEQTRPAQRTRT